MDVSIASSDASSTVDKAMMITELPSDADTAATGIDDSSSDTSVEDSPPTSTRSADFIATARPLRSSLKQSISMNDLHVCTKRSSWKTLKPPNMDLVRQVSNSSRSVSTGSQPKELKSSVTFKEIQIREYEQTIGDHPSVTYGPPISLDWGYEEMEAVDLDDYEENRGSRRSLQEMGMNYYTRKNKLQWKFGHSEEEIKEAHRNVNRVQRQRAVTKYFLPLAKVEDALQSAGRKAKRVVRRKRSTTV